MAMSICAKRGCSESGRAIVMDDGCGGGLTKRGHGSKKRAQEEHNGQDDHEQQQRDEAGDVLHEERVGHVVRGVAVIVDPNLEPIGIVAYGLGGGRRHLLSCSFYFLLEA
jgi:hypothetical protein